MIPRGLKIIANSDIVAQVHLIVNHVIKLIVQIIHKLNPICIQQLNN